MYGWQILLAHHDGRLPSVIYSYLVDHDYFQVLIARWCPRSLAKFDFNYRYYRLMKQRGNEFLLYIDLQVPRKWGNNTPLGVFTHFHWYLEAFNSYIYSGSVNQLTTWGRHCLAFRSSWSPAEHRCASWRSCRLDPTKTGTDVCFHLNAIHGNQPWGILQQWLIGIHRLHLEYSWTIYICIILLYEIL